MRIAVIDGQGGGIGKHIVEKLRKELPEDVEIVALGTNSLATSLMLKSGANEGATGENAIVFNVERVDYIVGTIGITMAHSMLGELTPLMAEAVCKAKAKKYLLPVTKSNIHLVGLKEEPLPHLILELVKALKKELS